MFLCSKNKIRTLALVVFVVILSVFLLFFLKKDDVVVVQPEVLYDSYDMDIDFDVRTLPSMFGYLIFDFFQSTTSEQLSVQIQSLALPQKKFTTIVGDGIHYQMVPQNTHEGTVIEVNPENGLSYAVLYNTNIDKVNQYIPQPINFNTRTVLKSPTHDWYVSDIIHNELVNSDGWEKIENWKVFLYNQTDDTYIALDQAAAPQWINNGEDILYLKADGVYIYSTEKDESTLVFGAYNNLNMHTDIALSSDEQYAVMTMPSINMLTVLQSGAGAYAPFQEVGRIYNKNEEYTSPVFAPQENIYAVVSYSTQQDAVATNAIETYSVFSNDIVSRYELPSAQKGAFALSAWTDFSVALPNNN